MHKGAFKRRLKWAPGELFAVPLTDGTFGIAQAIAPVSSYAIDFALLKIRLAHLISLEVHPAEADVVGIMATWRTVVSGGRWAHVGQVSLLVPLETCPNQRLIAAGNVQVTHTSWGLVEKFMSAWHGFFPWNLYPAFDFDSYLAPGIERPPNVKILSKSQIFLASEAKKKDAYLA